MFGRLRRSLVNPLQFLEKQIFYIYLTPIFSKRARHTPLMWKQKTNAPKNKPCLVIEVWGESGIFTCHD